MKTKYTCPLGSECETPKDGYVERCSWLVEMEGTDASGVEHKDNRCAIAWLPILNVEQSQTNREVAASVQSMRNEQTLRQDKAIKEMMRIENAPKVTQSQ